jgi:tetratricopeptide (TPR) repeat protein
MSPNGYLNLLLARSPDSFTMYNLTEMHICRLGTFMSLRNRIRILALTLAGLWVLVDLFLLDSKWQLLSFVFTVAIGLAIANFLIRRPIRRFREAVAHEDISTARKELAVMSGFRRFRGAEVDEAYAVNILILEGRYQEALIALQAIEVKRLKNSSAPVLTSQIAWCTAQIGEPAKAIELCQSVLPQMESLGPEYSSSIHLVLGAANHLLGNNSEAVPHLEVAIAGANGFPSRKSTAEFYLGESFSALGKTTEARKAYQDAYDALPNGQYGKRASERLK